MNSNVFILSAILQTVASCRTSKIDGNWSEWSAYSSCSRTCGDGLQYKHRSCANPVPNAYGDYCRGFYSESQSCNLQPCPPKIPDTGNCVNLANCSIYNWLDSEGEKHQFTRRQINRHLQSIQCNEEGSQTVKYKCSPPLEIEGEYENASMTKLQSPGAYGGGIYTAATQYLLSTCYGSLVIFYNTDQNILLEIILKEKDLFKFSKFSNPGPKLVQAFHIKTNGNCCWEIFEKETGRGRKAQLKKGDEWNPSFQPKLFRKTDCFEVKPNVKKSNF